MIECINQQIEDIICEQQKLIQELINLVSDLFDKLTKLNPKCQLQPNDDNLDAVIEAATTPSQHQQKLNRPISLGVSGGSVVDRQSGFCCGGTLGALLRNRRGVQFILSNKHVFAADIVPGGNNQVSARGDRIQQPGLLDINCRISSADTVARLTRWKGINKLDSGLTNRIDAAVAKVLPNRVRRNGHILGIGVIARNIATPRLDLRVMKAGRTTGITFGTLIGIDATVNVQYGVECASKELFVAQFVNQLVIRPDVNINPNFSLPGDSGSLIVTRTRPPRPVGLLFAGGGGVTFANRITDVVRFFRMSIVGKRLTTSSTAVTPATNAVADVTAEDEFNDTDTVNDEEFDTEDPIINESNPRLLKAMQVKRQNITKILKIPNCKGCYVRIDKRPGIRSPEIVLLMTKITLSVTNTLPTHFDDIPVTAIEIADIRNF